VTLASVVVVLALMGILVTVSPAWALSDTPEESESTSIYVPGPPYDVGVDVATDGAHAALDEAAIHVRVSASDEAATSTLAGGVLLVGLGGLTLGASRWRIRRRLEA
jgi:hypothetical protein